MVNFNLLPFFLYFLILSLIYNFILMMLKTNTTDTVYVIVLERP